MKDTKNPSKLSRAQLRDALDTVPVSHILGKSVSRELTGKQKKFCLEVAKGETKANAYRKAYNVKSKNTLQREPYQLTRDQRITNEIEALEAAMKAQTYQSPAALRALVIQSLVGVITNPDAQPGQITAAAKVLGTVTEVAAFTERKEVRTITSSEDARSAIMQQLRDLSNASADDAHIIDAQADDLMKELAGDAPHPPPTPQMEEEESRGSIHTIPLERLPTLSNTELQASYDKIFDDKDPTLHVEGDPPSSSES